jgi:hypothetical protein
MEQVAERVKTLSHSLNSPGAERRPGFFVDFANVRW